MSAAEAPVSEAAPVSPEQPNTEPNDLDGLLAQFDAATAEPKGPTLDDLLTASDPAAEPDYEAQISGLLAKDAQSRAAEAFQVQSRIYELEQGTEAQKQHAERLGQMLAEVQHREFVREEQEAFSRIVKDAQAELAEYPNLPPDFAELWFRAEATRNQELVAAFDNRRADPRGYERGVARALRELHKFARSMPDPELTADHAAVAAAVRGASSKTPPAEPAPNFGQMSDQEFRAYKAQLGF